MAIKLNFNDPVILNCYLEQGLRQKRLDFSEREKIKIGQDGGLAYRIFDRNFSSYSSYTGGIDTLGELTKALISLLAVQSYLHSAENYAGRHGFSLVSVDSNKNRETFVSPWNMSTSPIYTASLGSIAIESPEKLEKFLEMIVDDRRRVLADCYHKICGITNDYE